MLSLLIAREQCSMTLPHTMAVRVQGNFAILSGSWALSLIQGECCLVAKSYNILLIMGCISVFFKSRTVF